MEAGGGERGHSFLFTCHELKGFYAVGGKEGDAYHTGTESITSGGRLSRVVSRRTCVPVRTFAYARAYYVVVKRE